MDLHAFTNRLKALRFIDRADLRDLTDNQWMAFRADPAGYLITQGDDVAAKIWAALDEPEPEPKPVAPFAEEDGVFWKLHPAGSAIQFEIRGIQDGEMEIYGDFKWDGCVNWSTSEQCMFHFCGPADLIRLQRQFFTLGEIAKRELKSWDDPDWQAQTAHDFVAQVARMTTDAEMDGDMSGDDAVTTLSGLIEEAREITKGTA